jgi:hypothetical protein
VAELEADPGGIVVVPLTAVIVRTTSKRLRHLNRENQRVTAEMTQVVEEAARGHQVIRVFSGERYEGPPLLPAQRSPARLLAAHDGGLRRHHPGDPGRDLAGAVAGGGAGAARRHDGRASSPTSSR